MYEFKYKFVRCPPSLHQIHVQTDMAFVSVSLTLESWVIKTRIALKRIIEKPTVTDQIIHIIFI